MFIKSSKKTAVYAALAIITATIFTVFPWTSQGLNNALVSKGGSISGHVVPVLASHSSFPMYLIQSDNIEYETGFNVGSFFIAYYDDDKYDVCDAVRHIEKSMSLSKAENCVAGFEGRTMLRNGKSIVVVPHKESESSWPLLYHEIYHAMTQQYSESDLSEVHGILNNLVSGKTIDFDNFDSETSAYIIQFIVLARMNEVVLFDSKEFSNNTITPAMRKALNELEGLEILPLS